MRNTALAGVLLSTSSIRVSVYDTDGTVVSSGEAPITDQTTSGWERALREASPELPDDGICSVASTSGTAVLVDEYGEPVFSPQMYYESAPERARELRNETEEIDHQGWSIALAPTSPLPKLSQLKTDHPDRFSNVEWILSPATWLLYRFCYGYANRWRNVETDWTNALKFGADIRPSMPRWYEELFDIADLSPSLFPTIRPPGTFISVADGELADRTGFSGYRMFQGMTDGEAYVLANGCVEPGDFSVTFGETSVIKYVSESIEPHESLYYHRHPLDGYLPGASFDSGNALQWFSEHVLDRPVERSLDLARSVSPGAEDQVYLAGNRGPFHNPEIGLSILGLDYDMSLSTEEVQGRLTRGVATGIILAEWGYLSLIEQHFGIDIEDVRVMNTIDSRLGNYDWNRMRASIWDRRVTEMDARTTAGLLIPATIIMSTYDDAQEATDALLRQRSDVDPDPELRGQYREARDNFFDRWQRIVSIYEGDRPDGDRHRRG